MDIKTKHGGKRTDAGRKAPNGRKIRIVAYVAVDTAENMAAEKTGTWGELLDKIYRD